MEQCNRIYRDPIKCKRDVCDQEFAAIELARADQERINEATRRKISGVIAIQTQLGKPS